MAHISSIWRAEVTVPDDLWDWMEREHYGDNFARDMMCAQRGHVAAGQNRYSEITEWAEYHTETQARTAGERMEAVLAEWRDRMKIDTEDDPEE